MYYGDYIAIAIALFMTGFVTGIYVARRAVRDWLSRQRQHIFRCAYKGGTANCCPLYCRLERSNNDCTNA